MFKRSEPRARAVSSFIAGTGFVLLLASVVWWQILPDLPSSAVTSSDNADALGLVIIDPGHGGQDSGTIHAGIMEKDLALDISRRIERLLQAQNVSTLLTRTGDNYISLAGRAASANRERDAVFVSIHFDEAQPTAAGVETYYAAHQTPRQSAVVSWLPFLQAAAADERGNPESQSLAECVQAALVAKTHAANRGTRAEQFFVIANVRHPAVLVEGGFLTNKEDLEKLTNEEYREQLASAIVDGILRYREIARQHLPAGRDGEPRA